MHDDNTAWANEGSITALRPFGIWLAQPRETFGAARLDQLQGQEQRALPLDRTDERPRHSVGQIMAGLKLD